MGPGFEHFAGLFLGIIPFLFIDKAKIKVFAFLVGTKNVEWDF